MGKNRYNNTASAFNIAQVGHAPTVQKKTNILETERYIANQTKGEVVIPRRYFEDLIHLPSVGKAYNKMSERQQLLFWATLGCTGGLILGDYVTNGAVKDTAKKTYDKGSKFVKEKYANAFAPAPAISPIIDRVLAGNLVANESAVATETPAPDFLMYDGIKVIGDEQFQKDNVKWLEFAKRYSLPDYEFIKSNNKYIDENNVLKRAAAGGDGFSWNKRYLRELIENKEIKGAVGVAAHETGHNTVYNNKTNRENETYAQTFAGKAYANLSYVNQSEIDKFYQEFNFSQFKK